MNTAIVGHTGFVGGNLARQFHFHDKYNSKNIEEISGKEYDLLVCSGMPAAKWIANREPEADLANMQQLLESLKKATIKRFVLISTVDVYSVPQDVDENTAIDIDKCHAYGKHRLMLEREVQAHFDDVLIVRLPGLFGSGLKKNAIYDFIHDNETHKIHCDAVFQFYFLNNLWADIESFVAQEIELINVSTEPVSISEITREAFGFEFHNRPDYDPPFYDVRSLHAERFGGKGGFITDKAHIIDQLRTFVLKERAAL